MPVETRSQASRCSIQLAFPPSLKKYVLQEDIDELERLVFLRRFYHEAPCNVIQNVVRLCCEDEHGDESGDMTDTMHGTLRRSCKELMHMVEHARGPIKVLRSCQSWGIETRYLPKGLIERHSNVLESMYLYETDSLEGLPPGLISLDIHSRRISDLTPLSSCFKLQSLVFDHEDEQVRSVVALGHCTSLQSLTLKSMFEIGDLSPLGCCTNLTHLTLMYTTHVDDVEFLTTLKKLRHLTLSNLEKIRDLSPVAEANMLEELSIHGCCRVRTLKPLGSLTRLKKLDCSSLRDWSNRKLDLSPLIECTELQEIKCSIYEFQGVEELRAKLPRMKWVKSLF